jgi:hypothetical protein
MSRKSKHNDGAMIKALNPKDPDTKYTGEEPFFAVQPDPEFRNSALARSFSWYTRYYGRKEGKELYIQYLELNDRKADAKIMAKAPDSEILTTLCWLARMTLRGLQLNDHEELTLQNEISRLLLCVSKPETIFKSGLTPLVIEEVEEEKKESNRPNVQEIMRDKAREAAGEIEGLFDDFIVAGVKGYLPGKPVDVLSKYNILPQHIPIILSTWKERLIEISDTIEGKDPQLVEAYSNLTKVQLKNMLKCIDQVINDLNSYISVKKASKTPRKRKAVPVEKIVAKLKYLKEFKDDAAKLDLVSMHPTKIHGASECYLYDTAKRKLIYLCADEYSKTFTVKGTTILGFDSSKSQIKTLRKPGEQLAEFLKLGKPAGRKFFEDIKAAGTSFNGRTNDNMIILKAW